MNAKDERRKILSMVAEGNISVDEADHLLDASSSSGEERPYDPKAKFLRLLLETKAEAERQRKVDIRVPLGLLRSGIQIAKSLPGARNAPMTIALGTHTLALDLNGVAPQNVDEFMAQFKDLTTDIDRKDETLRLFCE